MNPFHMFPIFSCFVVFLLWFHFVQNRVRTKEHKREKAFWDKEEKANSTRKKDISQLTYLTIPLAEFPFGISSDEKVKACEKKIQELSKEKIVNLTGISNTDLKLKFGAPNLPVLSTYDANFTIYVNTLHNWAKRLYEAGFPKEALILLERAVFQGSDMKGSYVLLCTIYDKLGYESKKQELLPHAKALNSFMKEPIIAYIKENTKAPINS